MTVTELVEAANGGDVRLNKIVERFMPLQQVGYMRLDLAGTPPGPTWFRGTLEHSR